nr:MAG TPA: hypothetical protein [Caudoviricetes sp.]
MELQKDKKIIMYLVDILNSVYLPFHFLRWTEYAIRRC